MVAQPHEPADPAPDVPAGPAPDPPPGVRYPLLWRLAHRLVTDHVPRAFGPRCGTCAEPWPCGGFRLGERGLRAAAGPQRPRDPADPQTRPWWYRGRA